MTTGSFFETLFNGTSYTDFQKECSDFLLALKISKGKITVPMTIQAVIQSVVIG